MALHIAPAFTDYDPLHLKVPGQGSAFDYYNNNLINYAVTKSTEVIDTLDPETKKKAILLYQYAFASGMLPLFFSGRRTFAQQDALYRAYKDPNQPDAEIAAPPGRSYHNYGRAFDVMVLNQSGEGAFEYGSVALNYINEKENLGLFWGGYIESDKDPYHFANRSESIEELQANSPEFKQWLEGADEQTQREVNQREEILDNYKGLWKVRVKNWFKKNVYWLAGLSFTIVVSLIILFVVRARQE